MELNALIHQQVRLRIMAALAALDEGDVVEGCDSQERNYDLQVAHVVVCLLISASQICVLVCSTICDGFMGVRKLCGYP